MATAEDAAYHPLPSVRSDRSKSDSDASDRDKSSDNSNHSAGLDLRFLADLHYLVGISADGHPLIVLLSEIIFVVAITALALRPTPLILHAHA